jgi:hypothetical protein
LGRYHGKRLTGFQIRISQPRIQPQLTTRAPTQNQQYPTNFSENYKLHSFRKALSIGYNLFSQLDKKSQVDKTVVK